MSDRVRVMYLNFPSVDRKAPSLRINSVETGPWYDKLCALPPSEFDLPDDDVSSSVKLKSFILVSKSSNFRIGVSR